MKRDINGIQRAYTILQPKAFDEDEKALTVSGLATTPTPDRMGDSVNPMGASFQTPMPLLWQHDHKAPVGRLMQATPTKQGIKFVAEIPFIREAGKLKERVDEAIHSLKYGLVSAVSIGFRILGGEGEGYDWRDDDRSLDIKQWEWLELSLVTIPANSEAMISAVKSLDQTVNCPAIGETVGPEVYQKSGGSDILKPVRLIPPVYNEDRKVKSGTVKLLQGD